MIKIPIITGPTASGKSSLAYELAEEFDIELISADAYQIYKYMNIGTATPSDEELNKVKHYLINELYPDENYSAGIFFEKTEKLIRQILLKNKLPVVVGGTGLYVETLVNGIFDGPKANITFRNKMNLILQKKGVDFLYGYLESIDKEYADKITRNDTQKIIRAIEVYKLTGRNLSESHKTLMKKPSFKYEIFVIMKDRNELYDEINKRTLKMFERGWLKEVENLLNNGYSQELSSFKAIGYREIANYLLHNTNFDILIKTIQKKTRNFAKRQITWFKHMKNISIINIDKNEKKSIVNAFKNNYYYKK
jgi:tRNA dimethylallyltransferase